MDRRLTTTLRLVLRWAAPAIGSAMGVAAAAASLEVWPWDAVAAGFALGLLVAVWPRTRRGALGLVLAAGVSIAGLAAVELMARHLLPPPMMAADAYRSWRWGPTWHENACLALYPDAGGAGGLEDWARADDVRPLVLHLGDSMIEGHHVEPAARRRQPGGWPGARSVVELLGAANPSVAHVNAGFAGTGTDFQLALARRLVPLLRPAQVVLWAYAGNDMADIDRPYACCEQGPLLNWSTDTLAPRCPSPRWRITLRARLSRSPPPWPLRAAASASVAARHATDLFIYAAGMLEPGLGPAQGAAGHSASARRLTRAATALRDLARTHGADVIAVALPHRGALQNALVAGSGPDRSHRQLVAALQAAGLRTIDAWQPLAVAVAADRPGLYRDREHPGPAGHRLLAKLVGAAVKLPSL